MNSYKDLTPRMGVAYDLFGNGKTALKLNLGKYLRAPPSQLNYINPNPMLRMPSSTSSFGTAGVTRTLDRREREFPARLRSTEPARQRSPHQVAGTFSGQISNLRTFGENPDQHL